MGMVRSEAMFGTLEMGNEIRPMCLKFRPICHNRIYTDCNLSRLVNEGFKVLVVEANLLKYSAGGSQTLHYPL